MKGIIIVTGGAGFIGTHLVERLVAEDFDVVVIDQLGIKAGTESVRYMQGDIANWKDITVLFSEVGNYASCLFHLAGRSETHSRFADYLFRSNVMGTYNILKAARKYSVHKVVFSSSAAVYGDGKIPHSETSECFPQGFYALSKAFCEALCMTFTEVGWADTTILRLFNVYGPGQKATAQQSPILPAVLYTLTDHRPLIIHGDGSQSRDFVYIDDVVEAFLLAKDARPGTIYNVGTGEKTSINDLVKAVAEKWGAEPEMQFERKTAFGIQDSQAAVKKIRRALGWTSQVLLNEGLDKTIEWWRKE